MATEARQLVLIGQLLGRTMVVLMRNNFATDHTRERYVVEIDGQARAEYRIFVKALTSRIAAQQEYPNSHVKLRDAGEETAH
jgi:hypothetical protein